MKRLSFILFLLCLSVTVVHAQRYWPVSCSESGLNGKLVFSGVETPPNESFTQSIIYTDYDLKSEVVQYDEIGNWIYRKCGKWLQTRHIVYW